ncbi:hypothetical protein JW977_04155 [Candidatus Falkowbacteria bacterium]|nr:hypothetical protein [Candidatus Falkowbacteria bacterium]
MDASQITEVVKMRFKINQLKLGSLKGGAAVIIFEQINMALEKGICSLDDLGISESDWEKLRMDYRGTIQVNAGGILNKQDALYLAKKFGELWQESKEKDGDAKTDILKEMFRMWDKINYAIHYKLITNADLHFESSIEYFTVQREMHEIKDLMNMFGEKK